MKNFKLICLLLIGTLFTSACSCSKTKEYTIAFDSNGGTSVSSQTVKANELVKEPTSPTFEGYTFDGWYLDDAKYDFTSKVTKDLTLKAKWTQSAVVPDDNKDADQDTKTYTVTFNSDGGSKVSAKTVKENEKVSKPTNPTKSGYKFLGWYLNNKSYNFSTEVTKDITLVAKWEYIPTISYMMVDVPDNIVGQVVLYVTKDGEKVDGYLDITVTNGQTITKEIPKTGYNTNKKQIEKITNARVK